MTATADSYRGALEAIERILNRGGEQPDVLQEVVLRVASVGGVRVARVSIGDRNTFASGAQPSDGTATSVPIAFAGRVLGELDVVVDGRGDDAELRAFLERVAVLVSPYCRE